MNELGHWCDWCQCYHSSSSCFHPGRDRYDAAMARIKELEQSVIMLNAELDDLQAEAAWIPGMDVPKEPGVFLVIADDEMRQDYCYPDGHWLSCDGRVEYYRSMPNGPFDTRHGG